MTGWKHLPLADVATIERSGIQPDAIAPGTTYVGLENIERGGRFVNVGTVEADELGSSKFHFTDRHLLYGKLRPYLAKIACPDFDGICSTDILPVLPGPRIDRMFLVHFLRQPAQVELANSLAVGVNLPRLSPSALARFVVPLPPITEQQRIAKILDAAEALRAKRRAALAEFDQLELAFFLEMFGDPIQNGKHWPLARLGDLARIERGKFTPRPRNDPGYYGGRFPFIQTGDISNSGGRLSMWSQTLNEKGVKVSRSFPPGTVVIAIVGATLGVTAILEAEVYCPDSVIGLQADPVKASAEYLEQVLRFWRPVFVAQAPATARANMNLETLRPLRIPAPPLPLQQTFATRIAAVERLKVAHRASLAELDALFAALQHRAFRGEL